MIPEDLFRRYSPLLIATCNCKTKTPELAHHTPGCRYRLASELLDAYADLLEQNEELKDKAWRYDQLCK